MKGVDKFSGIATVPHETGHAVSTSGEKCTGLEKNVSEGGIWWQMEDVSLELHLQLDPQLLYAFVCGFAVSTQWLSAGTAYREKKSKERQGD